MNQCKPHYKTRISHSPSPRLTVFNMEHATGWMITDKIHSIGFGLCQMDCGITYKPYFVLYVQK